MLDSQLELRPVSPVVAESTPTHRGVVRRKLQLALGCGLTGSDRCVTNVSPFKSHAAVDAKCNMRLRDPAWAIMMACAAELAGTLKQRPRQLMGGRQWVRVFAAAWKLVQARASNEWIEQRGGRKQREALCVEYA